MNAYLEIIREDGTLERQRIRGEKVTVGRSPAAGIPIPDARDIDPEHLMIAPRADGCWVAVAQKSTPIVVNGEDFDHGMLAWGTEFQLGALTLKVTDTLPKKKKDPDEKKAASPVMLAFFIVIPLVGWLLLSEEDVGVDMTPTAPAPALFAASTECPSPGEGSRHRADRDAEAGVAKSERYPFSAQDGVQAVLLYRQAQACYQDANQQEAAVAIAQQSEVLEAQIEEDYQTHRLRLERSLEQTLFPDALMEARALIELLRHLNDPYLVWLRQLARQLQLQIDVAAS